MLDKLEANESKYAQVHKNYQIAKKVLKLFGQNSGDFNKENQHFTLFTHVQRNAQSEKTWPIKKSKFSN